MKSVKIPASSHAVLKEFHERFGVPMERLFELAVSEYAEKHSKAASLSVPRVTDCKRGAA